MPITAVSQSRTGTTEPLASPGSGAVPAAPAPAPMQAGAHAAGASAPTPLALRTAEIARSPYEAIHPGDPAQAQRAIKHFIRGQATIVAAMDDSQINGLARQQGLQEPPFAPGRGFQVTLKKGATLFMAVSDAPAGASQDTQLGAILKGRPALGRFTGVCPPASAGQVRSCWAVRPDWKPSVSHCLTLRLEEDAEAIVGVVGPQVFEKDGKAGMLPGGGLQVWFADREQLAKCSPVGLRPIAQREGR